jgi:hypothetical protein
MLREIEIHFSDYFTVHPVEVTCGTELMNLAHRMQREQGAVFATWGPVIERDTEGIPFVGKGEKR